MAPIHDVVLCSRLFYLDTNRVTPASFWHSFLVDLNAGHVSNDHVVFIWDTERCAHSQLAAHNLTTHDDGILLAEDVLLVDLQHNWEHCYFSCFCFLTFAELLHVLRELVLQVVDDVGGENRDAICVRLLLGICVHLDIEGKDECILRVPLLFHDHRFFYILLVHLSNSNVKDRNLHVLKEGEQCLQRPQRAGLHVNSCRLLGKVVEDALKAFARFVLQVFEIIVRPTNEELRARHSLFEAWCRDLHAHGGADRRMFDVLVLNAHLLHWLRCQQSPDGCNNWTTQTSQNDCVTFTKGAIEKHHIDGGPKAFDVFDFDHCTLQLLPALQLGAHQVLSELQDHVQQIRHTLTGKRAGWNNGDRSTRIIVLPIQAAVQPPLVQLQHDVVVPGLELHSHRLLLSVQCLLGTSIRLCVPLVEDVDLVHRNDERTTTLFQQLQRFHRLRLEPVHDVNDKDCQIGQRGSAHPEIVEGFVTRRINDKQARDLQLEVLVNLLRLLL
mmetsp:Transcript_89485/g.213841  ORF Transcript_89485/g.213841 Transcript_89485/m.213841 type:complete len:497 (-) Transcript_89485:943-2433(-)